MGYEMSGLAFPISPRRIIGEASGDNKSEPLIPTFSEILTIADRSATMHIADPLAARCRASSI